MQKPIRDMYSKEHILDGLYIKDLENYCSELEKRISLLERNNREQFFWYKKHLKMREETINGLEKELENLKSKNPIIRLKELINEIFN